jgi:hypothetical protein
MPAADFHDVTAAGLAQSVLDAHGIESRLLTFHHRALLGFFGPYLPIRLVVAGADASRAREILLAGDLC